MHFPDNLKYTDDHEWLRVEDNTAYIGITAHAASELGDIVFVDIDADGAMDKGSVFGTIEAVKTVADLYAPASGTLIEVNGALADAPETINNDPYGDGWIIKIELANPSELDGLMSVEAYKNHVGA